MTDVLDSLTTCGTLTPSAGTTATCTDNTVNWNVGALAVSTSATLTIKANLTTDAADGDTIKNQATATADTGTGSTDPDGATVTVNSGSAVSVDVVNDCELSITKDADSSTVAPGDDITYTITVSNDSNETVGGCTGISVEDDLTNTDLTCSSASVTDRDSLHFTQSDIDDSCSNDDVLWTPRDTDVLKPGDSIELQLVATTDDSLNSGDHVRNEVCVTGSPDEVVTAPATTPVCATRTTRIANPTATPTATPSPTSTPLPTFTPRPPLPPVYPTAQPQPLVSPPVTGTGGPDSSGGPNWIAIGMGLGVLALLIGFSAVLARKRIRVR